MYLLLGFGIFEKGFVGILPFLIGLGASAIGSAVQGGISSAFQGSADERARQFSAKEAASAREFNAVEAQKNRDFQAQMSNTAHQREVADLKAAGLNPMLSAMGGSGASAMSGSAASGSGASSSAGSVDTNSLASSALHTLKVGKELDAMDAAIDKTKQDAQASKASEEKTKTENELTKRLMDATVSSAKSAATQKEIETKYEKQLDSSGAGGFLNFLKKTTGALGGFLK